MTVPPPPTPRKMRAEFNRYQAQRLFDEPVRQVPRGAGLGGLPSRPFQQWPTGSGFEYFYGFVGGEANQYYPGLFEGTTPIELPKSP